MSSDIPTAKQNKKLISRLSAIVLFGLDQKQLDREGQLYLRLLCRLIDKAFDEYVLAKEYMDKEIRSGDKFSFSFGIMNHLENCINAVNRVTNAFRFARGNSLCKYLSADSKKELKHLDISPVRDMIEHVEKEIQSKNVQGSLFLTLDSNYEKICINNECISLRDLVNIMETYNNIMNEVLYSEMIFDKSVKRI